MSLYLPSVCVETCPPRAASSARCSTSEPLRVNALLTFPAVPAPPSQDRGGPCLLRPPPKSWSWAPTPGPTPYPQVWGSRLSPIPLLPAAWICILRYYQLRDWGVRKWHNQVILWTGLLCALGTSIVGNFQVRRSRPARRSVGLQLPASPGAQSPHRGGMLPTRPPGTCISLWLSGRGGSDEVRSLSRDRVGGSL